MLSKKGYGMAGMLLAILVIGVLLIIMLPIFSGYSSGSIGPNPEDKEIIENKINTETANIEKIRNNNKSDIEKINQEY